MSIDAKKFQEISNKISSELIKNQSESFRNFKEQNLENFNVVQFVEFVANECNKFSIEYTNSLLKAVLSDSE